MRRSVIIGAALVAGSAGAGCSTLGPAGRLAAAGSPAFESGWCSQAFPVDEAKVEPALLEGMADLKMRPEHTARPEPSVVVVDGRTHDGRHVRVTVRSIDSGVQVAARFGRFGDKALSAALMERIGVRLGIRPASAIPDDPPTSGSPASRLFSKSAVPDSLMLRDQAEAGYRDAPSP